MEKVVLYLEGIQGVLIAYGGKILLAVIVLIVGLWLIRKVIRLVSTGMEKRAVDPSLRPFLVSMLSGLLKVMLVISVAGMVGVEMTSFIAVLGGAALAIGLALQGSLANFAGGVLILLLKPFKVGDFIEGDGHAGTVHEIQIFYTYVTTPQGQEIIIPNGRLSNNAIKNYSFHDTRRFDMVFGIGYEDDIDVAKSIIEGLLMAEPKFILDKGHDIFVEELADSSVNIHLRGWLLSSDFWGVSNHFNEKVKKAFDANGVSIPFPQRDVHMYKEA